jgi:DNA-binding NtrC family response regulator
MHNHLLCAAALDFGTFVANPAPCRRLSHSEMFFVHPGWAMMHELRKPRILCIDDTASELEMRLRKSVLEIGGYEVWATRNPWEAVRIIRNNDVELILTEHIVPMNGGPPLTQVLKRLKPHVPIVLYSGAWAVPPDGIGMADMFITKLASTDELLCTIKQLLAKAQTRAAA